MVARRDRWRRRPHGGLLPRFATRRASQVTRSERRGVGRDPGGATVIAGVQRRRRGLLELDLMTLARVACWLLKWSMPICGSAACSEGTLVFAAGALAPWLAEGWFVGRCWRLRGGNWLVPLSCLCRGASRGSRAVESRRNQPNRPPVPRRKRARVPSSQGPCRGLLVCLRGLRAAKRRGSRQNRRN